MAIYIAGQILTTVIGKHLLTKAIADSSTSIYGSLSSICFYSKDIDKTIKSLDIKSKLKTIEGACRSLGSLEFHEQTIDTCLESIHEIILNIKCDLKIINKKVAKHEGKYFNSWRSLNLKKELESLKLHCKILDQRYELLANTMTILK
tara:strand:+ start:401 stop:844 length:444 start_codon:yes stop_codon:yes gene_type:complete